MTGIIKKYRDRLPVTDKTPVVTLSEGNTPLIHAPRFAQKIGLQGPRLYLKYEGLNPTGSFKDRGMTMAVSKALEEGSKTVICASTGNTAASAAAYAARAGIACVVLLPHRAVALGKLSQALIYGAKVLAVKGNFDEALRLVREAAEKKGLTIVNSLNPYRLEGQKTASFEIVEQLGRLPDYQFMPVGNAGNITACWKGYKELAQSGRTSGKPPKMMGFQAKGAAPIVLGRPVKNPKTIATAIRIGNPVSWKGALEAKEESGGSIEAVTDKEILSAYGLLAETEGVFCEPSSAAGLAGIVRYAREKKLPKDAVIVAILTGNGLKDPETPQKLGKKFHIIEPELKNMEKHL